MKRVHSLVLGVVFTVAGVAACDGENTGGSVGSGGSGLGNGNVGGAQTSVPTHGTQPGSGGTGVRTTPAGTGSTNGNAGTISCKVTIDDDLILCLTGPGTAEECEEGPGLATNEVAEVVTQCPSGALLQCTAEDSSNLFIYDQNLYANLKQVSASDPCSAFE